MPFKMFFIAPQPNNKKLVTHLSLSYHFFMITLIMKGVTMTDSNGLVLC